MSDEIRQEALNFINQIRSQVALGQFELTDRLPSASYMNKLRLKLTSLKQTSKIPTGPYYAMDNELTSNVKTLTDHKALKSSLRYTIGKHSVKSI
ncbi:hypothetical protein KIN20_028528 [Parelaphostrongylus tenuis]|uniref:Uncharacterized protein n=1 Tax=Parelaphostrongylus tenuis TaxID=148309 RepID=A0AAD5R1A6_PARTN|nr:hypothetical protein KIN20_028528 [Parelaphostrongylus tenuis]